VAEFPRAVVRGTVDFLDEDVPVGYLRALERTDQAEYGPLAELVARAVKDSLDRFLLPALAGPLQLLPLSALTRKGVTALALRRAAEKGRLEAQRRATGWCWYSTKAWVDRYARSRRGSAAKTRGA
jgi:cell filamentation protein, protein adenylyltransferase